MIRNILFHNIDIYEVVKTDITTATLVEDASVGLSDLTRIQNIFFVIYIYMMKETTFCEKKICEREHSDSLDSWRLAGQSSG